MRRILLFFPLLLMMAGFASAQTQTYTVTVSGTVTDSVGNPVNNYTVFLQVDSALCGGMIWNYTDSTHTAANGTYSFTIPVPTCVNQGGITVIILDCNGNPLYNWGFFGNAPANVNVTGIDFTSCQSTGGGGGGGGNQTVTIMGQVFDTAFGGAQQFTMDAEVFLIQYDSATGMLSAVDTTVIDSGGYYFFTITLPGQYLIKAALLPASPRYATRMPTYYQSSLLWSGGTYIPNAPVLSQFNITLITGNNPGGPGFIGGLVSMGANKRMGPGDPMPGVEVLLLDMSGNPLQYAWSDANGQYSFPNVAYGTYKVWAEVPGKTTTPVIVTLSPSNPSFSQVNIAVNSQDVVAGIFENSPAALKGIGVKFYPNPVNARGTFRITSPKAMDAEVIVRDLSGRSVYHISVNMNEGDNDVSLDFSARTAGVYFVELQTADGRVMARIVHE